MSMQIVLTDPAALSLARDEIDAELDLVEAACSRFRPDSEVSVLGRSGGVPTDVSPLLAELIRTALTAAWRTDGDVDPTVGAAVVALGYDRDFAVLSGESAPSATITTPASWSMIELIDRTVTVPDGVLLDLGATAKAFAADRCARQVAAMTGSGVLVNLGGDIATAGNAPAGGWQVLVHDTVGDPASRIALPSGAALATSSTTRRRWRSGGEVVHHILDPRTGRSVDPVWRTVTVAAHTCVDANTVATAAIVRGHRAVNWVRALGLPARFVTRDRAVRTVGAWPSSYRDEHREG
ncbi:MAG: FAD:protein FMN transferase [Rhodococcus sp. (in: high G+C Gram-positive bacteria)]|nr:MAG: FAD:protein FMN transferase [Rhodococcus sp. (in: high G+C Gram-positive bacteria)]